MLPCSGLGSPTYPIGISNECRKCGKRHHLLDFNIVIKGSRLLRAEPEVKYAFIAEYQARSEVSQMCELLGVSRSGYYDWCARPESRHAQQDRELLEVITAEFHQARKRYGSPRILHHLRQLGRWHSSKRIARLMAQNGLFACKKKRRVKPSEHDTGKSSTSTRA